MPLQFRDKRRCIAYLQMRRGDSRNQSGTVRELTGRWRENDLQAVLQLPQESITLFQSAAFAGRDRLGPFESRQSAQRPSLPSRWPLAADEKLQKLDCGFQVVQAAASQTHVTPIVLVNIGLDEDSPLERLDPCLVGSTEITAKT